MLPQPVKTPLQTHLQDVKQRHARDLDAGRGAVYPPMPWSGNIPRLIATGCGNTCFLPPSSHAIRAPAWSGGILPTHRCSNGLCMSLYARQASRNPPRATPFGMPLRPIDSKQDRTSARCRNYSVIRTSVRR
jgi:hypothetical protein